MKQSFVYLAVGTVTWRKSPGLKPSGLASFKWLYLGTDTASKSPRDDRVVKRKAIEITGIVQGIGYRPFVYNLAIEHSIRGWVLNNEKGVLIDAEGEDRSLDLFVEELTDLAPPLARIETLKASSLDPLGYTKFEIKGGVAGGYI